MDGNMIGFSFLNPGLHFAYQLKNLLFPPRIYKFSFGIEDNIPFPHDFKQEQEISDQILIAHGLEEFIVDLTQPCGEIQKWDTIPTNIQPIKYFNTRTSSVLPRTNTTYIPTHHVYRRGYLYDKNTSTNTSTITNTNKISLRPRRKHIRGPRRFTSFFETFHALFS